MQERFQALADELEALRVELGALEGDAGAASADERLQRIQQQQQEMQDLIETSANELRAAREREKDANSTYVRLKAELKDLKDLLVQYKREQEDSNIRVRSTHFIE